LASLVSIIFSANPTRRGVVERSGLSVPSAVVAEAAADEDASVKSFSAAFWGSVSLSRFARRSVLSAGIALLLQIAPITFVSSQVLLSARRHRRDGQNAKETQHR
jgi:hypothetical protein